MEGHLCQREDQQRYSLSPFVARCRVMVPQRCSQTFEHHTLARRALAVRPTLAVSTAG